ncbi:type II secretion system F family protein [Denitratisoma oestradiolicum]|uniref:General secretion pathway protein F n=1 Tax=Denitratisoma oestradiolicum TaxID=311182 RepID=A0A6S6YAX3_9PROT|nr:type II secretion system F family protein [Denitratisoma oestradiolicum]TWO79988.1 hypothetical protein CBW56_11755 [Denitratisoma oestradiolicum]CAB1369752.1 General secretion pathway protein F [Denitratisoma oestradiolicum]
MRFDIRAEAQGSVASLTLEALDEQEVRRQLAAKGLIPLSIAPSRSLRIGAWRGRRTDFSLLHFTQELLALLQAGLTVSEGIEALAEKERRPEAQDVLRRLLQQLREGKRFSSALEEIPTVFPPLYVGIIRAAERTSHLEQSLERYADYQMRFDALRARVLSALVYPVILAVVGAVVTLFLLGYVVPRFSMVYQDSGRELPFLSSLLMQWGNLVSRHGEGFALGFAGLIIGLTWLGRRGELSRGLSLLIRRLPTVDETVRVFHLARLYLTLGMLLEGGLPAVQALGLVEELLTPDLKARVARARRFIEEGKSLSEAFELAGLTTPVGIRMLRVGEHAGRMAEMLHRTARLYDADINRAIEWVSRTFEPALMIAIGGVVGLVVVLLYMPIFELAASIR